MAAAIALLVALTTTALSLALYLDARKARQVSATLEIWRWLEQPDILAARAIVRTLPAELDGWTDQQRIAADRLWRVYQAAAEYQDSGALYRDMLVRHYYPTIVEHWTRIWPLLAERRAQSGRTDLARDFELLAQAASTFRERHDAQYASRTHLRGLRRYRQR